MKDANVYSQDSTALKHELCSEKKCVTCFQNRGCMYEQYFAAPTSNLVTLLLQNQLNCRPNQSTGEQKPMSNNRPDENRGGFIE